MARPKLQLEQELLALPERERAELVMTLIASLNEGADCADADTLWLQESKRRAVAVREGSAETYAVTDVVNALKGRFSA